MLDHLVWTHFDTHYGGNYKEHVKFLRQGNNQCSTVKFKINSINGIFGVECYAGKPGAKGLITLTEKNYKDVIIPHSRVKFVAEVHPIWVIGDRFGINIKAVVMDVEEPNLSDNKPKFGYCFI